MEAYRHILINVHGGSSFQFSTASVGTSVSEVAANMHTQSGGKPDPAMHVHQTVGVPNSGGVQWARSIITATPSMALRT